MANNKDMSHVRDARVFNDLDDVNVCVFKQNFNGNGKG
jgi:hypothetical protein